MVNTFVLCASCRPLSHFSRSIITFLVCWLQMRFYFDACMAHMATPLYLCYISSTDITFAITPYPHMCTDSQYLAPSRCSLRISLPHSMALQRELLPSIAWNQLSLEWVAASEVIDKTAIIIRQLVPIFFHATAIGKRTVAKARQRLGCVSVKVFQQQLTSSLALEGKNTKHSWIFPSNLFCLKRQHSFTKRCTK